MGPAPALLDRRLLFFTGKGGVGKSTVTAATALLAAEQGKRVLLVEVDAKNNLTALFEHAPVGFEPRQVHPGVYAMQMDTEASLREYLKVQAQGAGVRAHRAHGARVRLRRHRRAGGEGDPHRRQGLLGAARVARGSRRLGSHRGRRRRDRSRDQPARRARARSRSWCRSGRSATRPDWMVELLSDPSLTALNVVTSPEEMPVNETIELVATRAPGARRAARCRDREPGAPRAVHPRRRGGVRRACASRGRDELLHERAGQGATAVLDAARLAVSMRRSRSVHLARAARGGRPAVAAAPVPVRPRPRAAGHPHGGGGAGPGAA